MNSLTLFTILNFACKKPVTPPPPAPPTVVEAPPPPSPPPAVAQLAQNFQKVFFELDSASLSEAGRQVLIENVTIMLDNPNIRIEVQGHADERGTTEYNLALGEKRAKAVQDFMRAQGIGPSRVKVVSYGEEQPSSQSSSEVAWSQNRRCEFVITFSDVDHVQGTE